MMGDQAHSIETESPADEENFVDATSSQSVVMPVDATTSRSVIPPQYDEFLTHHYDPSYTADISTKMRVPDRIGPVNGVDPKYQNLVEEERARIIHRAASMNVPDKITLSTEPNHVDAKPMYGMEGNVYSHQPLSARDRPMWQNLADESGESPAHSVVYGTPYSAPDDGLKLAQAAIPTPGSGLMEEDDDTDELLLMRRQISKLARHVAHLEEENTKRSQRELVLYPLVFGYVLFQLAKWLMQPR